MSARRRIAALALGVALADWLINAAVREFPWPIVVVPGIVLGATENSRGPFGIVPFSLTIVISLGVLALLPWTFRRLRREGQMALALLLGGGIANTVERLLRGAVTDVLTLGQQSSWNLADVAIILGIVVLVTGSLRHRRPAPASPARP